MIVAAGLGTRLRPFTDWCPKPALPVRGLPLVAYPLALLQTAGVDEVVINLHHLPDVLREAALDHAPPGLTVHFSDERELLHTGGAIRRVADFLRESETCIVLGGDMIVDLDLAALVNRHRKSDRVVTMALTPHPRQEEFGTIGLDGTGRLRRIGQRIDRGGEEQAGVYTWVNVLGSGAFETLPDREVFSHLDDWWAPWAERAPDAVGGEVLAPDACRWTPVGTPAEYLAANRVPAALSFFDADARARDRGVRFERGSVIGVGARIPADTTLDEVVVWDGERVPAGSALRHGVFAHGRFHPVVEDTP